MRIISGSLKGFNIKTPKRLSTRPATELVRGAMFSMLEHLDPPMGKVLDLFAGSGALGLEAISRGFAFTTFVELNGPACRIIKENLQNARAENRAQVLNVRVEKAFNILKEPFDVIVMDPPYRKEELNEFLNKILSSHLVKDDTVLAVNHSVRQDLSDQYGFFKQVKHTRHGDSLISIYKKAEEN